MQSLPLDELYLHWLYSQVSETNGTHERGAYWSLLQQLYTTEFVWLIPNDDNRAADGKDLRVEFLRYIHDEEVDEAWLQLGCSFLEMLVALSRWYAFEDEGEPRNWFWHMIKVLGLNEYDDAHMDHHAVEEIVNAVIWRTYRRDGQGGLFPLKHPRRDQRDVEIWYQLQAYLLEND